MQYSNYIVVAMAMQQFSICTLVGFQGFKEERNKAHEVDYL